VIATGYNNSGCFQPLKTETPLTFCPH